MTGEEIRTSRKSKGWTQDKLAEKLGISVRTVISYEQGGAIPKSKLAMLQNVLLSNNLYDDNEPETLQVKDPSEQIPNKAGNVFEELPDGRFKIWTKMLPVKAFASYLSEFRNAEFMEDLEDVPWIVDSFHRGRYMTIEAEGDSMNGGGLYDAPDGAYLLGRELLRHHWKDGFRESRYGWVIVHRETMVYKDVKSFDKTNGEMVLSSRSGLRQHPDIPININDVLEIWKVVKRSF